MSHICNASARSVKERVSLVATAEAVAGASYLVDVHAVIVVVVVVVVLHDLGHGSLPVEPAPSALSDSVNLGTGMHCTHMFSKKSAMSFSVSMGVHRLNSFCEGVSSA
jgi:hypothetical protein